MPLLRARRHAAERRYVPKFTHAQASTSYLRHSELRAFSCGPLSDKGRRVWCEDLDVWPGREGGSGYGNYHGFYILVSQMIKWQQLLITGWYVKGGRILDEKRGMEIVVSGTSKHGMVFVFGFL